MPTYTTVAGNRVTLPNGLMAMQVETLLRLHDDGDFIELERVARNFLDLNAHRRAERADPLHFLRDNDNERDEPMPETPETPTNITYKFLTWEQNRDEYAPVISQAFTFFRRNADGRYSDRTIMQIGRTVDILNDISRRPELERNLTLPQLVIADSEFSYDEETEVKQGGMFGVLLNFDGQKAIIAVHKDHRRKGLGTLMMAKLRRSAMMNPMWVHRTNSGGQAFLLSNGYTPTAINFGGSMRFEYGDSVVEDGDL